MSPFSTWGFQVTCPVTNRVVKMSRDIRRPTPPINRTPSRIPFLPAHPRIPKPTRLRCPHPARTPDHARPTPEPRNFPFVYPTPASFRTTGQPHPELQLFSSRPRRTLVDFMGLRRQRKYFLCLRSIHGSEDA